MKLLFDQNISFRIIKKLQDYFSGCLYVSDCKLSDCEDTEIQEYAKENDYAIVTFGSDFYDISIINGHPPKIIWIRTGNLTTRQIVQLMIENQEANDLSDADLISFLDGLRVSNDKKDWWEELTTPQKKQILAGFKDADEGKVMDSLTFWKNLRHD